jgi:hypothetical protein
MRQHTDKAHPLATTLFSVPALMSLSTWNTGWMAASASSTMSGLFTGGGGRLTRLIDASKARRDYSNDPGRVGSPLECYLEPAQSLDGAVRPFNALTHGVLD